MMAYFSQHILPKLCELSENGTEYSIEDIISLDEIVLSDNFCITNKSEFELMSSYIYYKNQNCIIFLGNPNYNFENSYLDFNFTLKGNDFKIPVIKNPWFDETGNFDSFVLEKIKKHDEPFPCKAICEKIGKLEIKQSDRASYEKYGNIVAKRNGYYRVPYTTRQYKDVPYYKRNDSEYIICLDMLHGTFEVFKRQGSKYEDYKGEYDFCGNHIENKKSDPNTHKCYRYY